MIKLVNVSKDFRFGSDTVIKPATLKSPRSGGFEYAIVNEFTQEEPVKITKEQAEFMFQATVPDELLILEPRVIKLRIELQEAKRKLEEATDEIAKLKTKKAKPAAKKDAK